MYQPNEQPRSEVDDTFIVIPDDDDDDVQELVDSGVPSIIVLDDSDQDDQGVTAGEDDGFFENINFHVDVGTQTDWNFDFLDISVTDQEIQEMLDLLGMTWEEFSALDN